MSIENARRILGEVEQLARHLGVPTPTVVAVTKSATDEEVLSLFSTGLVSHLAENRTSLFLARRTLLLEAGYTPTFHLIGSLQTNKVKHIAGLTDLIQSLDSLRLAAEIEKQAARRDATVDCLIEVNSGREEAKGGLLPEEVPAFLDALSDFPHIRPRGLMTMAPLSPTPEDSRPYFRLTRALFDTLASRGRLGDKPVLSMGMSSSWRVAMEEGANMIRIGRAFFGQNDTH